MYRRYAVYRASYPIRFRYQACTRSPQLLTRGSVLLKREVQRRRTARSGKQAAPNIDGEKEVSSRGGA